MTPTPEQQAEIEALIDAGMNTKSIVRRTGYAEPLVLKARRARCLRKAHERADKSRAAAALDNLMASTGDLLTALRQHMPVLASLPDRVAVLGIPVVVRRAAA